MLKKFIKKTAGAFGYDIINREARRNTGSPPPINHWADPVFNHILPTSKITYSHDLLCTWHNCDFMKDPRFISAYKAGKATDVHKTIFNNYEIYWRIHVICWAAMQAKNLEGDFVDCGVNTGIFARAVIDYINFNATGKKYYLLDTFTGLDDRYSTEKELASDLNQKYRAGKNSLYAQVQETFKAFNVDIIKGPVPDTLSQVTSNKIAYLSVDMNCAQPEMAALEYFWEKIVNGGIILLDDYGYANAFPEQKKAHDAFAASKGVEILTLPTCQGMIIKPNNYGTKNLDR